MGEIADMMIGGELCSDCGAPLEKAFGHPMLCDDCGSDHSAYATAKEERRDLAAVGFAEAARLAHSAGLRLLRHTEQHYSLRGVVCGDRFQLNLYPGNRRLYSHEKTLGYIDMAGREWTLGSIVTLVIEHIAKRESKR